MTSWRLMVSGILFMSKCSYDPSHLKGKPIGMFHCPECGEMVLAGLPHPDYSLLDDMPEDNINPSYYKGDLVMKIIKLFGLDFGLGNVIKYILRHVGKAGVEDLEKARWYLDWVIRNMKGEVKETDLFIETLEDDYEHKEEIEAWSQLMAQFTGFQTERFVKKQRENWKGWEDPDNIQILKNRLDKCITELNTGRGKHDLTLEADIANLAMFIWRIKIKHPLVYGATFPVVKPVVKDPKPSGG